MDRPRFSSSFLLPRFWPLWLGLGLLWLLTRLPYRALLWLGRRLGGLMSRFAGSRRRISRAIPRAMRIPSSASATPRSSREAKCR